MTKGRMPRFSLAMLALSAAISPSVTTPDLFGAVSNQVHVVESIDSSGTSTYELMSPEQYRTAKTAAVTRNRLISKAIEETREEWKNTYRGVIKAFPQSVAEQESVASVGVFLSEEAANAKLAEIKAKAEQRREACEVRLTTAEKQIEAMEDSIDHIKSTPAAAVADKTARVNSSRRVLKILKRDLADEKDRQSKQAEDLREARAIFDRKLATLLVEAAK
jgi:hypothetical protein